MTAVSPITTPMPWVDEEAPPDRRARMDLDARGEATTLRNQTRQCPRAVRPEAMRDPMVQDAPQPGVREHFAKVSRGGIFSKMVWMSSRNRVNMALLEVYRLGESDANDGFRTGQSGTMRPMTVNESRLLETFLALVRFNSPSRSEGAVMALDGGLPPRDRVRGRVRRRGPRNLAARSAI